MAPVVARRILKPADVAILASLDRSDWRPSPFIFVRPDPRALHGVRHELSPSLFRLVQLGLVVTRCQTARLTDAGEGAVHSCTAGARNVWTA
jgi:hypothetical protein